MCYSKKAISIEYIPLCSIVHLNYLRKFGGRGIHLPPIEAGSLLPH